MKREWKGVLAVLTVAIGVKIMNLTYLDAETGGASSWPLGGFALAAISASLAVFFLLRESTGLWRRWQEIRKRRREKKDALVDELFHRKEQLERQMEEILSRKEARIKLISSFPNNFRRLILPKFVDFFLSVRTLKLVSDDFFDHSFPDRKTARFSSIESLQSALNILALSAEGLKLHERAMESRIGEGAALMVEIVRPEGQEDSENPIIIH